MGLFILDVEDESEVVKGDWVDNLAGEVELVDQEVVVFPELLIFFLQLGGFLLQNLLIGVVSEEFLPKLGSTLDGGEEEVHVFVEFCLEL